MRRFRSCSGWAAVHKERSSWASSALKRWPSRRCASRRRRTLNTCENSNIQISLASSKSTTTLVVFSCWSSKGVLKVLHMVDRYWVYHFQDLIHKCVSCVLSNLGAYALRLLVTASSWSIVPRASCMRC